MITADVSFGIRGTWVPRDHGYALYGALCRAIPELHEATWLGVHPLAGVSTDHDRLHLRPRATLRLRLPAERIPVVLPLAGSSLELGGQAVSVGVPTIYPLVGSPVLDARIVLIKLTGVQPGFLVNPPDEPDALRERYRAEVERQLLHLEIRRPFELVRRARLTVSSRKLVGFSMRVSDLSPEESIRLMTNGIGGRRRMGAGLFRPARGN